MSKMKSLVFAAAGAAGIYAGIEHYNGRFSDENIWTRQRPQIEAAARSERAPNPDSRFAALRAGLDSTQIKSGTPEARCRFETEFQAMTNAHGDAALATRIMDRESYNRFHRCTKEERLKETASHGYPIIGALAALYGVVTFLSSLIDSFSAWRKERNDAKKATAVDSAA